jgi:hypothetical protein
VLIPELGLENALHLTSDLALNSEFPLRFKKIKLAQLEGQLKIYQPSTDDENDDLANES